MNKRKTLVISLLVLSSLLIVGCNSLISKDSSDVQYEESQELYNRIVEDYYEQRILKNGAIIKYMTHIYNLVNDGESWGKANLFDPTPKMNKGPILTSDVSFNILNKNEKGAYICLFSSPPGLNALSPYEQSSEIYVDGTLIVFPNAQVTPKVWYQGKVLFLNEAYALNIVSKEDIANSANSDYFFKNDINYDSSNKSLIINKVYSIIDKHYLSIQKDYYSSFVNKETPIVDNCSINHQDVHVIDSFGKINGKELLFVATDGVLDGREYVDTLEVGLMKITNYSYFEPMVYYNHSFQSLQSAYTSGTLNNDELKIISDRLLKDSNVL